MSFIAKQTRFLPFQGVKLQPNPLAEECGGLNAFCQVAEQQDTLAFQMHAFETDEQVTDGEFDSGTTLTNWTNTGWLELNANFIFNPFSTLAILQQNNVLAVNNFYRITIDYELVGISSINIAETNAGWSNATIFQNFTQNDPNKTIRTTFTLYREALATHLILTAIGNAATNGVARIYSISVIEIGTPSDYTIEALDLDGVVQGTIPTADISQVENVLIINSIWNKLSLTNGCFQFRVTSAYDIFNDTFADNLGWILINTTITGGVLTFNSASSGISYIDVLQVGTTYSITYDVVNFTSGSVRVQAGNTQGILRTGNGTFVETLTCTSWGRVLFGFTAGSDLDVDNVVVSKVNNIDGFSECFDLQDSHDCTKLLKWKNEENIMGFDYSTDYEHSIRLLARRTRARYPNEDKLVGLSSAGLKTLDYAELRKTRVVELWYAREWVFDAIAGAFMHDESIYDGIDYILKDPLEPEEINDGKEGYKYRGLMKAEIELDEKDQNLINRNE